MTDWYKKFNPKGSSLEEDYYIPSVDEIFDETLKQSYSKHKLRLLGHNESQQVMLSEEQRGEHMHIIGTTGEGKSRFLEHLIREDIKRGLGLCLLDPSDQGDTIKKILAYCAKIGHQKVIVIDPTDMSDRGKIACLNPLRRKGGVSLIRDAIQTTFGNKDQSETPRIQRYLTAILTVLHNAGLSLHEAKYFSDPIFASQRIQILEKTDPFDRHRLALEEVFTTRSMYLNELQSTLRRLETFQHPILDLMFSRDGLKFTDLISKGWVVLVNLYSQDNFEPIHGKLLGTIIINEIVSAIDRLRKNGWQGRYYLYIDEAGEYATYKLANLLAYKRKAGLSVIIAHQYFNQFSDKTVLDAVMNLCKLKVAFNIPSREDRDKIVKMFYGGSLDDRDVSYVLSQLKKQHAVIKLPKQDPVVLKIPDVPDIKIKAGYEEWLYNQDAYIPIDEIRNEIRKRFEGQNTVPSRTGRKSYHRSTTSTGRGKVKHAPESPQEPRTEEAGEVKKVRRADTVFLEAEKLKRTK